MSFVWLRLSDGAIGIEHGFLPADQVPHFAHALDLAQALQTRMGEHELSVQHVEAHAAAAAQRMRDQAQAEADAIVAAGRAEAAALEQQARRDGFDAGFAKAVADWHARRLGVSLEERAQLQNMDEAIARIACTAVERMVASESPRALFEKALSQVGELLKGVAGAVLRVHPDQVDEARQAVANVVAQRDLGSAIEVVGDASLGDRGCRFESDHGTLDASLDLQLNALRQAFAAASRAVPGAVDPVDPVAEAAEAVAP